MKRFFSMLMLTVVLGAAAPERPTRHEAHARLAELANEVVEFRDETGGLPSSLEGLAEVAPGRLLADPWGHEVYYLRVAGGFWLMSWGADGEPGGDGDEEDLVHIAR